MVSCTPKVANKFWLRNFIGYSGSNSLVYGKDIDAVAGATISAQALIDDVKLVLNRLSEKCF